MPDPRSLEVRLPVDHAEIEYAEHSRFTGAKKTVETFPYIQADPTNPETLAPIESAAASGALALKRDKAYRVVSDGSIRFRMSIGASAAVATDIYLPANIPVIIATKNYDTLSFIRTGGTFIQAVEVR